MHARTHTHTHFMALWNWSGQPGWAGTKRNIHHSHLSWSSIILYLLFPSIAIHGILPVQFMCLTVFSHNLCPSFLWSTSWSENLHFIFHIFSPNHCLLFAAHAHTNTITTCFAVVPKLYNLILVYFSLASSHMSVLLISVLHSQHTDGTIQLKPHICTHWTMCTTPLTTANLQQSFLWISAQLLILLITPYS